VARSASTARCAATSVAYVLLSVVMELVSVLEPCRLVLAARMMCSGGCGSFAVR
jgi:hypothetical protein